MRSPWIRLAAAQRAALSRRRGGRARVRLRRRRRALGYGWRSVDSGARARPDELLAAGRAHDAQRADRLERLRNVEAETARMLAVLVRATGARRVLELGTSNG